MLGLQERARTELRGHRPPAVANNHVTQGPSMLDTEDLDELTLSRIATLDG